MVQRLFSFFLHVTSALDAYRYGRADEVIKWNNETDAAFEHLRASMCSQVMMCFPNYDEPFHLHTDASNSGIGGWLGQMRNGREVMGGVCLKSPEVWREEVLNNKKGVPGLGIGIAQISPVFMRQAPCGAYKS